MQMTMIRLSRATVCCAVVITLAAGSLMLAQDQQNGSPESQAPQEQASPGWRRFSGPPPSAPPPPSGQNGASNPYHPYGSGSSQQATAPAEGSQASGTHKGYQVTAVPAHLTLQRGVYITVRTDQILSSDHNQPGDAFTATLEQPLVIDGLVVAQQGETVGGRVVEAKKAGRIKGVSHLAVQLTNLTLVDGRQISIDTRFIGQAGPTSKGRDAGAVATTTVLGTAIGAAANGGVGAAVGAGAGAIAGAIGVLVTRGHPTIIYPESSLTFRLAAPVTISTDRAPEAFHYVTLDAYSRTPQSQNPPYGPPRLCNGNGCAPPPVPPPYFYSPVYYPPYYSYFGPPFYPFWGPTFFFGRGFRGHWH